MCGLCRLSVWMFIADWASATMPSVRKPLHASIWTCCKFGNCCAMVINAVLVSSGWLQSSRLMICGQLFTKNSISSSVIELGGYCRCRVCKQGIFISMWRTSRHFAREWFQSKNRLDLWEHLVEVEITIKTESCQAVTAVKQCDYSIRFQSWAIQKVASL